MKFLTIRSLKKQYLNLNGGIDSSGQIEEMKKTVLLIIPLLFLFLSCEDKQGKDCAEVEGGTASVDDCGLCTGGTTGLLPNYLKDCFSFIIKLNDPIR